MAWVKIRFLFILLGTIGFVANSTQAHVQIEQAETITIKMCGSGDRTIELTLPEAPSETPKHQTCDACSISSWMPEETTVLVGSVRFNLAKFDGLFEFAVTPRSPLWPGAPPQGPPARLKA